MVSMDTLELVARVGVFIVSTALFILMVVAYRRIRTARMLGVASAFGLFFSGGVVLVAEVLSQDVNLAVSEGLNYGVTLVALVVLAASLLKGA